MPKTRTKPKLCPMLRKPCIEDDCMFWVHIRGTHPQTGEPVDECDCATVWQPLLLIENSQQQRATAAAVESFRNEMVKANNNSQQLLAQASTQPLTRSN